MKKMKLWWNLFLFHVSNRKEGSVEVGGFRFVFRKYSMLVRSLSDNWRMRVLCGEHAYGYLRESWRQNRKENLEGYAVILYSLAVSLTRDSKLVNDVTRDIKAYAARVDRQAQKEAKRTEKESDSEILMTERVMEEDLRQMKNRVENGEKKSKKNHRR